MTSRDRFLLGVNGPVTCVSPPPEKNSSTRSAKSTEDDGDEDDKAAEAEMPKKEAASNSKSPPFPDYQSSHAGSASSPDLVRPSPFSLMAAFLLLASTTTMASISICTT